MYKTNFKPNYLVIFLSIIFILTLTIVISCNESDKEQSTNVSTDKEESGGISLKDGNTNEMGQTTNRNDVTTEYEAEETDESEDSVVSEPKKIEGVMQTKQKKTEFDKLPDTDEELPSDTSGETYKDYGINPEISTEKENISTFSIDVDTGSYTIARRFITENELLPRQESVRAEEFVNYFDYNYDPPKNNIFSINTEIAPSIFRENRHLLKIGIQGKDILPDERKSANLVFLIDVSGSMRTNAKLPVVKESLRILLDHLKPDDYVGIAIYSGQATPYLKSTSVKDKQKIINAIDKLEAGGTTNAEGGIKIAYEMISENYIEDGINRVILCSDGDANVGNVSPDVLNKTVESYRKDLGITLSTFGYGMGNYNDVFMEQLANKGDGNYGYIDNLEEAKRTFGDKLDSLLYVIARDVKIQVVFNKETVKAFRLIGYENRMLEKEDFLKYDVDAGEIGPMHNVTALYELEMNKGLEPNNELLEIKMRWKDPSSSTTGEVLTLNKALFYKDVTENISDTSPYYRLGASIGEFAEILRGSQYAKNSTFETLIEQIDVAKAQLPTKDEKFDELKNIVSKAEKLKAIP